MDGSEGELDCVRGEGAAAPCLRASAPHAPALAAIVIMAAQVAWRDRIAGDLAKEGFVVLVDPVGDVAFDERARRIDAAVVDLSLRERSALAICAAWRQRTSAPIIAIAPHREHPAVFDAYSAGADHVATVSITSRQLAARLRSMLRRTRPRRPASVKAIEEPVSIRLDAERRVATVREAEVPLNIDEYELLRLLLDRAGRVVPRSELSESVAVSSRNPRALDVLVRRLREKLESVDGERRITVVRGVGFRFDVRSDTPRAAT